MSIIILYISTFFVKFLNNYVKMIT